VPRRLLDDPHGLEECGAVERRVVDDPRRARVDELGGVGALVRSGVLVRNDDHRQAEGRCLRQRGRARPPDHQIRGGQGIEEIFAEERGRSVAIPELFRERGPGRRCAGQSLLSGEVDHVDPLDEPGQGPDHRVIQPASRL
jgi:hypothetical protein